MTKKPTKFPLCEKYGAVRLPDTKRLWGFSFTSLKDVNNAFTPQSMEIVEKALKQAKQDGAQEEWEWIHNCELCSKPITGAVAVYCWSCHCKLSFHERIIGELSRENWKLKGENAKLLEEPTRLQILRLEALAELLGRDLEEWRTEWQKRNYHELQRSGGRC